MTKNAAIFLYNKNTENIDRTGWMYVYHSENSFSYLYSQRVLWIIVSMFQPDIIISGQ